MHVFYTEGISFQLAVQKLHVTFLMEQCTCEVPILVLLITMKVLLHWK